MKNVAIATFLNIIIKNIIIILLYLITVFSAQTAHNLSGEVTVCLLA